MSRCLAIVLAARQVKQDLDCATLTTVLTTVHAESCGMARKPRPSSLLALSQI